MTGATKYELLIRNVRTSANTFYEQNVVGTSWTPPSNLANDNYRWWVRPVGTGNVKGSWSAMSEFSTGGRTSVLSPSGTANGSSPVFSWRQVDGAARYELWVDRIGVQTGYINLTNLTATNYTHSAALPAGNYRTWVRAVSTTSQFSSWSPAVEFTVADAQTSDTPEFGQEPVITSILSLDRPSVSADRHSRSVEDEPQPVAIDATNTELSEIPPSGSGIVKMSELPSVPAAHPNFPDSAVHDAVMAELAQFTVSFAPWRSA